MTRVLALADHSKIGCITQRRFAKVGTKTHPQRGAALDRNGLSVSTETACRFEPKSPVGNSEICSLLEGDGFELPVPRTTPGFWPISTRTTRRDRCRKKGVRIRQLLVFAALGREWWARR